MQIEIPDKYFNKEELENTPKRIARFYKEWLEDSSKYTFTTFDAPKVKGMIVQETDFYLLCAHHLLPFFGKAYLGYIPQYGKICGTSKLARLVDEIAHKPQLQESLTEEVADRLQELLSPKGVMVITKCEHLCMSMRGIKKPGHRLTYSAIRGSFEKDR